MTGDEVLEIIEGIVNSYSGNKPLGFGMGTLRECNAKADPMLPFVWVFTDPDMTNEVHANDNNPTDRFTCTYAVLDIDKLDSPHEETRKIYKRAARIGKGIKQKLEENEYLKIESFTSTPKLKFNDNAYSGKFFQLEVTFADTECINDFENGIC